MHLEGDKKIWKILAKAVFCLILFFCFSGIAQASFKFNPAINYQGKLTKPNNALVPDDDYNMKFRLCDDASCTVEIWSETRTSTDMVPVSNGLFSVMLGDISDISAVNFNQTLYLEVSIGGTSTPDFEIMLPRKKFGAVPAAFEAQKLGGKASSEYAVLANNETVSGTWQFVGSTTLATTTMALSSRIGDVNNYFELITSNLKDPGNLDFGNGLISIPNFPLLKFHNDSAIDNFSSGTGAINNGLTIIEDVDNRGNMPSLGFASNDIMNILGGASGNIY